MSQLLLLKRTTLLASALSFAWGTASAQAVLKLTQVPATTPARDSLFVAGSFNSWNPRSPRYALQKQPDGTYQISLPPSLGRIEYKFTRGSWPTVEIDAQNQQIANRTADLTAAREIASQVLAWDD